MQVDDNVEDGCHLDHVALHPEGYTKDMIAASPSNRSWLRMSKWKRHGSFIAFGRAQAPFVASLVLRFVQFACLELAKHVAFGMIAHHASQS